MEDAIFHLLKQKVHVSGVGRTDSGVHARRYVANFHADCTIPMDRLPYALSSFLPEDIAVSGAVEVPKDFDARFNCTKKEYAYYLFPSTLRDPFHARTRIGTIIRWILQKCRKAHSILSASRTLHP